MKITFKHRKYSDEAEKKYDNVAPFEFIYTLDIERR